MGSYLSVPLLLWVLAPLRTGYKRVLLPEEVPSPPSRLCRDSKRLVGAATGGKGGFAHPFAPFSEQ